MLYFITVLGSKFLCSEVIAPVKSEVDDICLYIINFEDLTSPPSPVEQPDPASRLSKCNDYKRYTLCPTVLCARLWMCIRVCVCMRLCCQRPLSQTELMQQSRALWIKKKKEKNNDNGIRIQFSPDFVRLCRKQTRTKKRLFFLIYPICYCGLYFSRQGQTVVSAIVADELVSRTQREPDRSSDATAARRRVRRGEQQHTPENPIDPKSSRFAEASTHGGF